MSKFKHYTKDIKVQVLCLNYKDVRNKPSNKNDLSTQFLANYDDKIQKDKETLEDRYDKSDTISLQYNPSVVNILYGDYDQEVGHNTELGNVSCKGYDCTGSYNIRFVELSTERIDPEKDTTVNNTVKYESNKNTAKIVIIDPQALDNKGFDIIMKHLKNASEQEGQGKIKIMIDKNVENCLKDNEFYYDRDNRDEKLKNLAKLRTALEGKEKFEFVTIDLQNPNAAKEIINDSVKERLEAILEPRSKLTDIQTKKLNTYIDKELKRIEPKIQNNEDNKYTKMKERLTKAQEDIQSGIMDKEKYNTFIQDMKELGKTKEQTKGWGEAIDNAINNLRNSINTTSISEINKLDKAILSAEKKDNPRSR